MREATTLRSLLVFLVIFGAFLALFLLFTQNPVVSTTLAGLVGAVGGVLKSKMTAIQLELEHKREEAADLQEKTDVLRRQTSELQRRLAGPRFELPPKNSERYVRVAIAGLGGTGKTSLIRKISGCRLADPRKKTGAARTYSIVRETAYEDHTEVLRLDLEDYRGQNASDLLESVRHAENDFPVTSLLLMVDLFEVADEHTGASTHPSPGKLWDQARVDKHIREWSDQMIGLLMDTLPDLKHVGLFINKVDLIKAAVADHEYEIRNLFAPLITSIRARSSDRLVKIYLGSATTDRMLATLLADWGEEATLDETGRVRRMK